LTAYQSRDYLATLAPYGKPIWLPRSGAGILEQPIEGTPHRDLRGPYPLFCAGDWGALPDELRTLEERWVSFVAVADPLTSPEPSILAAAFPDLCRPYKEHFVVDLSQGSQGPRTEGHRRMLRKAHANLVCERVDEPICTIRDWTQLYAGLSAKHGIKGIARFSDRAFAEQFEMPEIRVYRAIKGGATVGMALWFLAGDKAYYHLGASSEEGYASGAGFGLFERALEDLASGGAKEALLGAGAGAWGDPEDGLSRFKSGWATGTRTAYICGRILNAAVYRDLSGPSGQAYFPAYRVGTASAMEKPSKSAKPAA
jgi:hypothetical protein